MTDLPIRTNEDASALLASMAADMSFDDLSDETVQTAKWGILDTLGVCIAATGAADEYVDPVRGFLGSAPSGVVPAPTLGKALTPLDAILWWGALAHSLDYDDVAGYSHPSAPAVAAALPTAHAAGIDGKQLITAVALGQDMVIRLAQAVRKPLSQYGWLPSFPGVLGAAVTTAKVLGLNARQTRNSLGLALHQTSGTMEALASPGSAYRAVREGFNARAGALSAYLAAEGMPGDADSLEGQYGYFTQFFQNDYDPAFIRQSRLLGPITSFKPWPCAGHPQLFLTAVANLIRRGEVTPETVKTIRITGCSDLLAHQCAPIELRSAPRHSIDAKVSIPFLIGKLLVHGTLTIADFSTEGLQDPQASALGRRVQWRHDPTLRRGMNDYGIGIVEVEHEDGTTVRAEAAYPLGHPENPLKWDDVVSKFHSCMESAGFAPLAEKVVDIVDNLESLADVTVLLDTIGDGPNG
ncbi:MAG: MmgE/PrpD family protein [Hyphomicrobiales bacterium]|nr:MAG: MmgE/PrpD family protein [Hyphomicrobiales bacterium]